jgi:uncharacterized protein
MNNMTDLDVDSNASALCRTCGLCCDGTVFDDVPITEIESSRLRHRLLVLDATADRELRFEQRCSALGPWGCDVYAERPSSCSGFRCKLLRRVDADEVSLPAALALIQEILAPVMRLDAAMPAGRSFQSRRNLFAQLSSRLPWVERDAVWRDLVLISELIRRELIEERVVAPDVPLA